MRKNTRLIFDKIYVVWLTSYISSRDVNYFNTCYFVIAYLFYSKLSVIKIIKINN